MGLRVLQVISSAAVSGAERHAVELAKRLQERGHRVDLVSPEGEWIQRELKGTGVGVHQFDMRGGLGLPGLVTMRKLVKREGYDIVHAHLSRAANLSLAATKGRGIPAICSVHVRTNYAVYRIAARGRNRVVAVSDHVRKMLEAQAVPSTYIDVVHNGTDFHRAEYVAQGGVKEELGIPQDRLIFGLLGRVAKEKGHTIAVEALPIILAKVPEAHLVCVGRCEGEYGEDIKCKVKQMGLQDRITFTGNRDDVPRLLDSMEVLILPSSAEACPLSILEGMARGRPVVGARIGGVDELVFEGETGFLAEQTAEDFAEKIGKLLLDCDMRVKMGNRARALIEERFSFDQMVSRFEGIYSQATGGVGS